VPDHISDKLADNNNLLALILTLPSIVGFLRLLVGILEEKSERIREGMKIMGLSNTTLYTSWILWQATINLIVSLLITIILSLSIWKNSSFVLIFLWHYTYMTTLIA